MVGPRKLNAQGALVVHAELVASGASTEIEAIFRSDYRRLVALARLLVDGTSDAEEVVQEAFARALAGGGRPRGLDVPSAYITQSVMNLARDRLRRRRTARLFRPGVAASSPASDVDVLLGEQQHELQRALSTLPTRQRECVVLRYLLELSTADTAAMLEISPGSVKAHLSRGLTALRSELEDQQ